MRLSGWAIIFRSETGKGGVKGAERIIEVRWVKVMSREQRGS